MSSRLWQDCLKRYLLELFTREYLGATLQLDFTFLGMIDSFESGIATGWVLDRRRPADPISVDLYVDGERVAETLADLPRSDLAQISPISTNKGFRLATDPHITGRLLPRLELYFGNSNERIPASEEAMRFINRPIINLRELEAIGCSPWTPSPPGAIVRHITGQSASVDEQRRSYLTSGMISAADVYNILIDIGLEARRPGFRIIDIGCGSGRQAAFLKQYMPDCKYLGLDVWADAIAWAQKSISAVQRDVKFILLEKASGYAGMSAYRLPAETRSTHLVMALSLFTHLSPPASLDYFSETRRVLLDNGVALFTFMLLDENSERQAEAAANRAGLHMTKTPDACWFGKGGYLDIYYSEAAIRRMAEQARLDVIAIRRGHWYRRDGGCINFAAYQDMIVLRPTLHTQEAQCETPSHILLKFGG
jgi:SAM-dependent methyltransferase